MEGGEGRTSPSPAGQGALGLCPLGKAPPASASEAGIPRNKILSPVGGPQVCPGQHGPESGGFGDPWLGSSDARPQLPPGGIQAGPCVPPSPVRSSCGLIVPLVSVGSCQGRFAPVALTGGCSSLQSPPGFPQTNILERGAAPDPPGRFTKQSPSLVTLKKLLTTVLQF